MRDEWRRKTNKIFKKKNKEIRLPKYFKCSLTLFSTLQMLLFSSFHNLALGNIFHIFFPFVFLCFCTSLQEFLSVHGHVSKRTIYNIKTGGLALSTQVFIVSILNDNKGFLIMESCKMNICGCLQQCTVFPFPMLPKGPDLWRAWQERETRETNFCIN